MFLKLFVCVLRCVRKFVLVMCQFVCQSVITVICSDSMQRTDDAPQRACSCLLLEGILSGKQAVIMLNDRHFSCSKLRNSYHWICLLYMLYGRVFSWQPFWLSVRCCWGDRSSCVCWTLSVHSPAVIADFQFDNVKICTLVFFFFFKWKI